MEWTGDNVGALVRSLEATSELTSFSSISSSLCLLPFLLLLLFVFVFLFGGVSLSICHLRLACGGVQPDADNFPSADNSCF